MHQHHVNRLAKAQASTPNFMPSERPRKRDRIRGSAIPLTGRSELRIDRQGDRVSVRIWSASGGQYFPTRDGCSIPVEHLAALIEALHKIGDAS